MNIVQSYIPTPRCHRDLYFNGTSCTTCPLATVNEDLKDCVTCPSDIFNSTVGGLVCLQCPKQENKILCSCPEGSINTVNNKNQSVNCYSCSIKDIKSIDKIRCKTCPLGQFTNDGKFCYKCPDGSVSSKNNTCIKCPPGAFSNDSVKCHQCSKGTFNSVNGAYICDDCEPGYYADTEGSLQCKACPNGEWSNFNRTSCIKNRFFFRYNNATVYDFTSLAGQNAINFEISNKSSLVSVIKMSFCSSLTNTSNCDKNKVSLILFLIFIYFFFFFYILLSTAKKNL